MTTVGSGSVRSDTQPLQPVHEAEPVLSVAGWSLAGKPRDHEEALPSGDNGGCLGSNPNPGEQAPVMLGIVGSFSSKPPVTVGSVSLGRFGRGGWVRACRQGGLSRYYPKA